MLNKSILVINNIPEISEGITGGSVITKRNEKLIKTIFEKVFVYNHIYKNKSKLRILLQSFFFIGLGLSQKKIKKILDYAQANNCEYIFIGYSTLGAIAKAAKKRGFKIITFFHNVEYNYFCGRISGSSFISKFAGLFIKNCIKKNEGYAVKYSDKLIVLNKRDSSELSKLYSREADIFIPITFDDVYNEKAALTYSSVKKEKRILFVGSDFFGNTEGLFWFIENCLDEITAELVIVGSGMDKYSNKYHDKEVCFKGFVEDLSLEYYLSDIVVLPILSGSGMKTKTCEALMYGKTIVATQEAFEGYSTDIYTKKSCYLCKSPEEFIKTINTLLSEQKSKINNNSRDIFLNKYETSNYIGILEQLIK